MNGTKVQIINYVSTHNEVCVEDLSTFLGIKTTTVRQYLSEMSKNGSLIRTSRGYYAVSKKQNFIYQPSKIVHSVYKNLAKQLPFNDFCMYDGRIFNPLQHHVFCNNAVYVETNKDSVETVFERLKTQHKNTFRQPNNDFMTDYVDLRQQCFIVKSLVTESPIVEIDGVKVPSLEKILVDIQKDADFDYLRGSESFYIFQTAYELYNVNNQRLLRYAKRRGAGNMIEKLIKKIKNYD